MKTAEEVLKKYSPFGTMRASNPKIIEAMEEYAQQFKYDYSRECKCTDSPGETWCCNLCGLPTNKHTEQKQTTTT